MSSQNNQNNLTVTVASAATSLLLLGMFYPNSAAARRRRRKLIEGGEIIEGEDDADDDDDDIVDDDGEINDGSDSRNANANVNEDDKRSTISSIASSMSSSSLRDDIKIHPQQQQQQQQQMKLQNVANEDSATDAVSKMAEKSILRHTSPRNGVNGNYENMYQQPLLNSEKIKDARHVQYDMQESMSHQSSHSLHFKQNRTQSMSDDSEDSDLSYGEDHLTKNFRHVRRGSINANASLINDADLSITLEDSEWGDSSSEAFSETSSTGEPKSPKSPNLTLLPIPPSSSSSSSPRTHTHTHIHKHEHKSSTNSTHNMTDTVNSSVHTSNLSPPAENDCIYLDYNGTTPIHPMVLNAMVPYFTRHFGNPSSSHAYGLVPRAAVGKARRAVLYLLHDRGVGANTSNGNTTINGTNLRQHKTKREDNSIVFTGCGTEADNMAIRLALESSTHQASKKKHIITSNVEHPAIDQALKALEAKGECDVTFVPVNKEGIVSAQDIVRAIRPNQTILVTLMLANNESGALQPVREVSAHCRKHGILFHTDAAQAVGKVSISLEDDAEHEGIGSNVDMLTIVGHKIGAPKGVAALYIRPGCLDNPAKNNVIANGDDDFLKFSSKTKVDCISGVMANNAGVLLVGGGQENGLRAGTENVPYIVGMGCAASLLTSKTRSSAYTRWEKNAIHMENMRSRLLHNLTLALGEDIVRANGPKNASQRLPNTLSVGLRGIDSAEMLKKIQMHVACSAGSACHAQGGGPSPVLKAMGVPEIFARGTLRLSVGPSTRPEDVDKASRFIVDEARRQISS